MLRGIHIQRLRAAAAYPDARLRARFVIDDTGRRTGTVSVVVVRAHAPGISILNTSITEYAGMKAELGEVWKAARSSRQVAAHA